MRKSLISYYWLDQNGGHGQVIEDYLARVSTEGFTQPSNAVLDALETFFNAINTSKLDFVHIFRMGSATYQNASSVKFVRPSLDLGTYESSLTYGATGITGNNSNMYFDTKFNPVTDGLKYSLDSASRFYYVGADATLGTAYEGVAANASNRTIRSNADSHRINSGNASVLNSVVDFTGAGFKGINRSDNTNVQLYKGLTKFDRTQTSTALLSGDQLILRASTTYSNARFEMYGMGESLTEAEMNAIANAYDVYRAII